MITMLRHNFNRIRPRPGLLGSLSVYAFSAVYLFDGLDPANCTINGKKEDVLNHRYRFSLLTMITSFFGLPNRMRSDGQSTILNILKNLFFFPEDNASWPQWLFQMVAMITLIPLAFNLLSALLSTITHTVMLFTECLPLSLALLSTYFGSKTLEAIFFRIAEIGSALTSPILTLKKILASSSPTPMKILKAIMAGLFAGAIYTLVFPYAAQLVLSYILPYLAAQFPTAIAFLTNAFLQMGIADWLLVGTSNLIGEGFSFVWFGLTTAVFPLMIAAATGINLVINYALNKFFTTEVEKNNSREEEHTFLRFSDSDLDSDSDDEYSPITNTNHQLAPSLGGYGNYNPNFDEGDHFGENISPDAGQPMEPYYEDRHSSSYSLYPVTEDIDERIMSNTW